MPGTNDCIDISMIICRATELFAPWPAGHARGYINVLRLYIGKKIVKEGNHQKWRRAVTMQLMTCGSSHAGGSSAPCVYILAIGSWSHSIYIHVHY